MYGEASGKEGSSGVRKAPKPRTQRREVSAMPDTIDRYDATWLVGLKTVVLNAATRENDDVVVPQLNELMAAAAVWRCLCEVRLQPAEIKAIRKIMGCTLADLAKKLGERTAPETVSRWETGAQPIGGYAEKLFRLLACETLKERAPGVEYDGSMIADLSVYDAWMADPTYELPAIELSLVKLKERGSIRSAWGDLKCAA
jgi:DNA-binding transcriptional regulator YiaG